MASEKIEVFVLMPFGMRNEYQGGSLESDYVFDEIIKPGVIDALGESHQIVREVDESKPGSITISIVRRIASAQVVVVDITGWNPNVFLELGIRYALRNRVTVVIAQEDTQLPFDIAAYRVVNYNRFRPREGRAKIADCIKRGLQDELGSDSIVFDTFKNISVEIPGLLKSFGEEAQAQRHIMSWEEYMMRIQRVANWLAPAVAEGRYVPHAMLGISNGGLIVADLLGKAVFSGKNTPVLGLWAQRYTKKHDYFDNPYNEAIVDAIRRSDGGSTPFEILLVDDHFGSGNTAKQAIDFLYKHFGSDTSVLYIPLVSSRLEHVNKIEDFLPFAYASKGKHSFNVTREEFLEFLYTDALYFPYLQKQISKGLEQISRK